MRNLFSSAAALLLILAALASARPLRRPLQYATTYSCLPNGDLPGEEVAPVVRTSQADCEAACSANPACTFYVYTTDKLCALKGSLLDSSAGAAEGHLSVDANQFVAACVRDDAVSASSSTVACATGFDFVGTELQTYNDVASATDCQDLCFSNPECTFFISTTDALCVLKKDLLGGSQQGSNGPQPQVAYACLRVAAPSSGASPTPNVSPSPSGSVPASPSPAGNASPSPGASASPSPSPAASVPSSPSPSPGLTPGGGADCSTDAGDLSTCMDVSLPPKLSAASSFPVPLPTVDGTTSLLDALDLNYLVASFQYLGIGGQCAQVPIYTGAEILGWKDAAPAAVQALRLDGLCSSLPLNPDVHYVVGALPLDPPTDAFGPSGEYKPGAAFKAALPGDTAICAAINPCTSDYLFGFSGLSLSEVPLGDKSVSIALSSLSVSAGGQLTQTSGNMQVWTLAGADSKLGTVSQLSMPAHLAVSGLASVSQDLGFSDIATLTITGKGTFALNADPAGDGAGGADHELFVKLTSAPKLTLLGVLTIDLAGLGEADYLLHWRYISDTDASLTLAFEKSVSLAQLISSIPGVGDTLSKLLPIDLNMQSAAGLYADKDNWGVRFALSAGVGLTDDAAKSIGVDSGTQVSGELIIKGNRNNQISLVFKVGDSEFDIQACLHTEDCVEDGHHCFMFFCRANLDFGSVCNAADQCKTGHCMMGESITPLCSNCEVDEDCPDAFCEVNPVLHADTLGTCRPRLPSGEGCDRDANCQSGTCGGGVLGIGRSCD